MNMAKALGDITQEPNEKVLTPARDDARHELKIAALLLT
jgi:hypothetical protein